MARTKSAKKATRAAERRTVFNIRTKRTYKDSVKEIGLLIAAKKGDEAQKMLPAVQAAVDKAVKTHVLQRNTAARIKSNIVKRIRAIA
jgi:small subunit ribosomal protein S20